MKCCSVQSVQKTVQKIVFGNSKRNLNVDEILKKLQSNSKIDKNEVELFLDFSSNLKNHDKLIANLDLMDALIANQALMDAMVEIFKQDNAQSKKYAADFFLYLSSKPN
ncbi:hypothetical protein CL648_03975, partial [bacterium]|nr:hypothetical protein [bacterium]